MAPGTGSVSGLQQTGCGISSPATSSAKSLLSRTRGKFKSSKADANTSNTAKLPVTATPVVFKKRVDSRIPYPLQNRDVSARTTVEKTLAVRQPTKLPATNSARSNGLWFEGEGGKPGHRFSTLYTLLDKEQFRGYGCLQGKLVSDEFLIPDESIQRIDDQLAKRSSTMPWVNVLNNGKQYSIPYVGTDFREYCNGLNVGIAIQHIYMSILRRENALQSITPFASGPNGEWTLYIGDLIDSMNIPLLQTRDVGLVMSIHPKDFRSKGQDERLKRAEIKHHSCQLDDSKGADMLSQLGGLIHTINEHISKPRQRRSVLVHCVAGLSRSVNVALGWAQREFFEHKLKDLPPDVPARQKFDLLTQERTTKFEELKRKRPGVKCDNFKAQLERHAAQMVGLELPPAPAPPPKVSASEEHGGGGYLKEAVVWFYYIYHFRPSPTVIQFGYERIAKVAVNNSKKGGSTINSNNTLQRYLEPWCDACRVKLQPGKVQKGNI